MYLWRTYRAFLIVKILGGPFFSRYLDPSKTWLSCLREHVNMVGPYHVLCSKKTVAMNVSHDIYVQLSWSLKVGTNANDQSDIEAVQSILFTIVLAYMSTDTSSLRGG